MTNNYYSSFQQHSPSFEQSQLGSLPVSQPVITAAAHPTPELTVMAFAGQFFAQAPHSIQRSLYSIFACLSLIMKTLWGQTSVHLLQPIHFSVDRRSVTTFFKYLCFIVSSFMIRNNLSTTEQSLLLMKWK